MRKIAFTVIASALLAVTGCSNFPVLSSADRGDVFVAPSYYGKEIPNGFIYNHLRVEQSNGHEFRGYHFGKRHWYF